MIQPTITLLLAPHIIIIIIIIIINKQRIIVYDYVIRVTNKLQLPWKRKSTDNTGYSNINNVFRADSCTLIIIYHQILTLVPVSLYATHQTCGPERGGESEGGRDGHQENNNYY